MTAEDTTQRPSPNGATQAGARAVATSVDEVPFRIEELFFSRTDARGRILSGNDVFQRVSLYGWDEMIERPHNIIRHPDMPRAVFYVLWERIRAGQPVGAYVKNRAKDGRYYWVYAVVTPLDDGYLSVRLKPGSALFAAASGLYGAIRRQELETDCKPAESAGALLGLLSQAGFGDYPSFMARALGGEIRNRDAALGRPTWQALSHFEDLLESAAILLTAAARMLDLASAFRYTPSNLRIQAARIGDEGRAIGEISTNYGQISESIVENLRQLHLAAQDVFASVNDGLFLACTARLQEETAVFFNREAAGKDAAFGDEAERLMRQTRDYSALAAEKFDHIKVHVARFFDLTADMKRLSSALAAVRVMGKVESVTLYRGMFAELIGDLEKGQEALSAGLSEIWGINNRIRDNIRHIDGQN
ncbi:MAG: PAS domain-containing protein [Aquamicrobium sp.]|uniref:PAS domain-containing protein n=1 Tax=Aquamicrobium sp. TaxID=1872579 RepID=UPI00349F0491|nr:PAS domain-containing protein [Aquamicrobium sp.]